MRNFFLYFKGFDWIIFMVVLLLICFSLATIYSITLAREDFGLLNFKKQVLFAIVGIILLFLAAFTDHRLIGASSYLLYFATIILLLGVLIFSESIRGMKGWLTLGSLSFQPVELAKIVLVIFLAKYFSNPEREGHEGRYILISTAFTLPLVLLVCLQPDFGSALILVAIWLGMLTFIGVKRAYFLFTIFIIAVILIASWFFVFEDYQRIRIMTFFEPRLDPLGRGYNITQSVIAIGSGQVFGRGLGFGPQSQLKFLPEAQADFIFAVFAEELGFIGVFLILSFFGVLFYRIVVSARRVRDDFGLFLILGFLIFFVLQVFVNIGMNMALLPVAGISLPFVSCGGSSLITSLIAIGIIESVILHYNRYPTV